MEFVDQYGNRLADLRTVIATEATHALMDADQRMLPVMAYYDALTTAFTGWDRVSMLDLTSVAKEPFAWFLFHHPERDWWASYFSWTPDLHHPYTGSGIHHRLVQPAHMVAAETLDEFLDAAHVRASAPTFPDRNDPGMVLSRAYAQWLLGHFPDHPKAQAYLMLLGLAPSPSGSGSGS